MKRQILCVGTGGQGVVWLGRAIGQAAHLQDIPVLSAETHGMAMRGGSVVCHVKLGGYESSIILPGRADLLLALDPDEAARHRHYLAAQGKVLVNTQTPTGPTEFDALAVARYVDAPRAVNAVVLGFAAAAGLVPLNDDALRQAVAEVSPPAHRAPSLAAYEAGRRAARG
jgi:indolepyruvate ferredoxin oxidoreductase beta subunit